MTHLERAINTLLTAQLPAAPQSHISSIDPRALIAVTVLYLTAMLSVPVSSPGMLIWFAVYPIISAPLAHIAYERVMVRSLWVLPFVAAIAIFNPIYDRTPAFVIGSVTVSTGWISLLSVILRGLLSLQALLILIHVAGFNRICEGLRRLRLPGVLVTQLLLAYRYMGVLMTEALVMHRARAARGFGRRSYPLSIWAPFVGQLLLRSLERSRRIYAAMQARGFDGSLTVEPSARWNVADTLYCLIWTAVIIVMRTVDLSSLLLSIVTR